MKCSVKYSGQQEFGRQEEITAAEIAEALECGNPACGCHSMSANGWQTHCPCHEDAHPSFSINEGEGGKVLVRCHTGCDQMEVISTLREMGLWSGNGGIQGTYPAQPPRGELVEAYSYLDAEGQLLFQACRYSPKAFRLRKPVGKGEWAYSIKGTEIIPYNLPEVLQAETVFIAEGEKDCNNLKDLGLTATCNPMGAGKWRAEFAQHFKGRKIIILPDNDSPGGKHALSVARQLHGSASSIKILALPGLPEKGDVSDWLAAGGTAEELQRLAEEALEWQPQSNFHPQGRGGLRAVDPDEEPELVPVKAVLPDAPAGERLVVPEGWFLSGQGVGKLIKTKHGLDLIKVSPTPILIAGRLINIADGTERVKLAFPRDGEWRQPTVERVVIATTRAITELANRGAPVTSGNANDLVKYLADFEAVNLKNLPRAQVSEQMGWQGEGGRLGFLWGRTLLRPGLESAAIDLDKLPPDQWQKDLITFRGADSGDEQIADAMRSVGSFEEWVKAIHLIADYPRVLLAVFGALTPPLLTIMGVPNFIQDWCERTSVGKTTTLRAAGSVWGNPNELQPASVVGTWDSTRVWISRASTVLHSLPLILDDTKRCKYTKEIAKILYDVASGRDKGRGSLNGTRRTGTWNTILLTTGETPITSFSTDGGTRARVLTLWGPPFGRADESTTPLVQQINQAVLGNYGHAGPLFVKFLLSHQADWEKWQKTYHKVQEAYQDRAGGNSVAGRLCNYFAALDLAAGIAHAALDLPWAYRDPIEALWHDLISGVEEADVAARGLALVSGWAKANQMRFYGRQNADRPPFNGWAGRWDSGQDWEYIAFLPHFLRQLLTEHEFEPEAVIRGWQDRGWLLTGGNRRQKQVRLDGENTWTIAIRRSAIEREGGNDDKITE